MRFWRIVFSLYAGVVISFLLLLVFGDAGTREYRKLLAYHQRLEENIEELRSINLALEEELESLATDPEKVRLLAREMGYFAPEDGVVHVVGLPRKESFYRVGKVIEMSPERKSFALRLKMIGLAVPAICYLLLSFIRGVKQRGSRAGST